MAVSEQLAKILKSRGLEYKDPEPVEFMPTGIAELDELMKGGIPKGRLTEIAGPSGSGKSMLAQYVSRQYRTLYIDTEDSLDEFVDYPFDLIKEFVLENIWAIVNDALDSGLYDLIVVDSIAAATTTNEIDDDNDPTMKTNYSRSALLTKWLRQLPMHMSKHKTAVVFINHLKPKVNVPYSDFESPGGLALQFTPSIRLRIFSGKSKVIVKNKEAIGQKIKARVEKSRFGARNEEVEFKIEYKDIYAQ